MSGNLLIDVCRNPDNQSVWLEVDLWENVSTARVYFEMTQMVGPRRANVDDRDVLAERVSLFDESVAGVDLELSNDIYSIEFKQHQTTETGVETQSQTNY